MAQSKESQTQKANIALDADQRISAGAWMALIAALLGWMFDGLEMGLFPLVARPAIKDLLSQEHGKELMHWMLGTSGTSEDLWRSIMIAVFLVGAATGGVVFGWLGDRIGRVRAMTLSVFTYAIFMGLCGFSQNVLQMFILRFIASLGMGGEWSLGVALVMEIWPNRSRGWLAGLIGAASNVGFLLIAVAGLILSRIIDSLYDWLLSIGLPSAWVNDLVIDQSGERSGWRLLMLFGAAPALLTFFIRLMVPESKRWTRARDEGTVSNWKTRDMLAVVIGAIGPLMIIYLWAADLTSILERAGVASPQSTSMTLRIVGSFLGLGVALVGYTYPVIRFLNRVDASEGRHRTAWRATIGRMLLGACLSGVALIGTWASLQHAPSWADQIVQRNIKSDDPKVISQARSEARSYTQIASALGAIFGTIGGALIGNRIGRRITYTLLCIGSLLSSLAFFQLNQDYNTTFLISVFIAGGLTASFYGWLPLYLPEIFSTGVRATGQGFSYNFGRILAAIATLQLGFLMQEVFKENYPYACSIMSAVYLFGVVIIWFAPETHGQPLPD